MHSATGRVWASTLSIADSRYSAPLNTGTTALTRAEGGDGINSIVHVISDSGPHPYFRTLIEADPLDRRRLTVGCLGPPGPLQEVMAELGVDSFALGVTSRRAWP